VFLYLLFLGSEARVLAGRSLRKTASAFIALYNSNSLGIYSAQLESHVLWQCLRLVPTVWAAIDWSWSLGL
jgi:hypothetical protein